MPFVGVGLGASVSLLGVVVRRREGRSGERAAASARVVVTAAAAANALPWSINSVAN